MSRRERYRSIETFPSPSCDQVVRFECSEFTSLCPKTGQPDFAQLTVWYKPREVCLELKSLKLYLWSFRQEGHFHEQVAKAVADDLVSASSPEWLLLEANFWVRGGIHTVVFESRGEVPGILMYGRQSTTSYRGY